VYGLEDNTIAALESNERQYKGEGNSYPSEYIEGPGSIIEAIQRGVQLVAEPYAYGDWMTTQEDPNYTDLTITAIVASDTFDDDAEQGNIVPRNSNSYTLEGAILDAIDNFYNEGVNVSRAYITGDIISQGASALARSANEEDQARFAERVAQRKNSVTRKP
jgi:hypothetical protein